MKILCLHGYTQSASIYAKKASGLRKLLQKNGHELVFIDGPVKVELQDLPFEPGPDMADADMRAWWVVKEGDPRYLDFRPAFDCLKQTIIDQGPFDAVLGFSQGAGLTAMLLKELPKLVPDHPPIKFAVMYSGFKLQQEQNQHFYEPKFTTPALHVMGSLDTVVPPERSMMLYDCWVPEKRTLLTHPGGHYTPSQKPMLQAVLKFVNDQVNPPKEEENSNNWDEFDNIGK